MSVSSKDNSLIKGKNLKKNRTTPEVYFYEPTSTFDQDMLSELVRNASILVLLNLRDIMKLNTIVEFIQFKKSGTVKSVEFFNSIDDLLSYVIKVYSQHNAAAFQTCLTHLYRSRLDAVAAMRREINFVRDIGQSDEFKTMENKLNMLTHKNAEDETIVTNLCCDNTNYLILKSYENRYMKNLLNDREDQIKHLCDLETDKLAKERDSYMSSIVRELGTFKTQLYYLEAYNTEIKIKIDHVTNIQEKKAEKYDNLLNNAKNARDEIENKHKDALQSLIDHREWVTHTRRTDAALVFQKRWRTILEERAILKAKKDALLAKKLKMREKKKARR